MSKPYVDRLCQKGPLCLCYGRCCPVDKPKVHCSNHFRDCHHNCRKG